MFIDDEFVSELTRMVWNTVLGLEVWQKPNPTAGPEDQETVTTFVDISGAWEGSIALSFSGAFGRRMAATMLACSEAEATPTSVKDALGELANVLGGNVKGILPGPCKLSLPKVQPLTHEPGERLRRLCFECDGGTFSVTVLARSRPADDGASC